MKRLTESKKLRIERIVNARVKLLQEDQKLNEFDWGALGSGLASLAANTNPIGMMYNSGKDLYQGVKNVADGQSVWDAAGDFANSTLDRTQQQLDVAGMIPAFGIVPDAINVATSGVRGGVADYMGDKKGAQDHYGNMGLSALAAIPGAGLAAGAGKIGKNTYKAGKAVKYGGKGTKQVYKSQKNTAPSTTNVAKNTGTQPIQNKKVTTAGFGPKW